MQDTKLHDKLLSGAIAGVVGTSLIYPIDFVKTTLQNSTHKQGIVQCARRILADHGMAGFYRGLLPNLVGVFPEKAIKLAVNDTAREAWARHLGCKPDKLPLLYSILCGATAGFCQVIVTNPMEMVKIQMQTSHSGETAIAIVRTLGVTGLYKHSLATLCRDVPFSFLFFPSVALLKDSFGGADAGLAAVFGSGIIAGAFASGLVTPMDVVKTRLQAPFVGKRPFHNMASCYRYIIAKESPAALFRGAVPRMLIVSPLFAISLLVYEFQQRFINRK